MFTSFTVTLPDGNDISFTDSGPVPGSRDYTTLVILHGAAFNGHGFEGLHALAARYNLRTVVWQRRDYPGSSLYSDAELDDLNNGRKVFLDRLALSIGYFVENLVTNHNIPELDANRKAGGLALLGWSLGTATVMTLFSDPKVIPSDLRALLERNIKAIVLYDPPHFALGYEAQLSDKVYAPWANPECKTPEQVIAAFKPWVSSYYDHPQCSVQSLDELDVRKRAYHATTDRWTAEELDGNISDQSGLRSDFPMFSPMMQSTIREQTRRVMHDERLAATYFPAVGITYIFCARSCWTTVWAARECMRDYNERVERGEMIRRIRFMNVKHGNHFLHADYPEDFLEAVTKGIREPPAGVNYVSKL